MSSRLFLLFERLGVHIVPKHYYTPIADYHWLRKNREAWMQRAPLTGVQWDIDVQFQWLERVCRPYYHEVAGLRFYEEVTARRLGPGFGPIESQVLHCFIRTQAPPRIIEIGSGVSTACMLHAVELNSSEGRPRSVITCIEPYPRRALRDNKRVTHIKQFCQTVPDSVFAELQPGDMLFIDSSHAVKVGSDVVRIYLDILPRLMPGVFVHIHDINLPYLYPRSTLSEHFVCGSQETVLLLALLTNNQHLCVLSCLSALHYDRTERLAHLLRDYRPQANCGGLAAADPPVGHFPNSIWILVR